MFDYLAYQREWRRKHYRSITLTLTPAERAAINEAAAAINDTPARFCINAVLRAVGLPARPTREN